MRRMFSEKQIKELADERVETLVEGGTLDNAKPIYCHPISFTSINGTYTNTRACLLLFNNDSTPFTKTSFLALFPDFNGRILLNGFICVSGTRYLCAYIGATSEAVVINDNNVVSSISLTTMFGDSDVTLTDNVNRIN